MQPVGAFTMPANFLEGTGDAFLWPDERIDAEFDQKRIYPLKLESSKIANDVLSLYAGWLEFLGIGRSAFEADRLPWVPVGAVGPVLVLGHGQPDATAAPLPPWLSQHVLLLPGQHREIVRYIEDRLKNALSGGHGMALPDKNPLTGTKLDFSTTGEVLSFITRYMVITRHVRDLLATGVPENKVLLSDFPEGFAEAVSFFLKGNPVADVRPVEADPVSAQVIPEKIRDRYRAVGLHSTPDRHYIALPKIPDFSFADTVETLVQGRHRAIGQILAPESSLNLLIEHGKAQRRRSDYRRQDTQGGRGLRDQTQAAAIIDAASMVHINPKDTDIPNEVRLNWTIWKAFALGASDIHYDYFAGQGRVRARVDGLLRTIDTVPPNTLLGMLGVARAGIIKGFTQASHDTQDARTTIRIGETLVNVRANLTPHRGESQVMVLRLLPKQNHLLKIENLGIPDRSMRILRRAISAQRGIIFVTGPTGSGKTTTLYACLSELNKPDIKINTIEDPVEIELEGATQSMVDEHRGITFDLLMQSVLRQDPDVVLIGEVRSRETAMLALQAAQTGHLVFATVHANDEIEVFYRVMNLLDDEKLRTVLASVSLLSQSQRLLQKVCPACSVEVTPSPGQAKVFKKHGVTVQRIRKTNPAGCAKCWAGYHGRVACMSLLPITKGIAQKIASGADAFALREAAEAAGNRSLYVEALQKVAEGVTAFEEAELWRNPWDEFELS